MTKSRPSLLPLLILICAVLLSVPLVLGFLGALHPAFDSMGHFRLHLAAAMALAGLFLLFTTLRREGLVVLLLAVGAIATGAQAMGWRFGAATLAANAAPADFKLLQFNMLFKNRRPEELVRLIAREHPDIITLQEVSRSFMPWFEHLSGTYPYQKVCPSDGRIGGVAILSRRPWAEGSQQGCFEKGFAAVAQVDFGGRKVDVAALHLYWPWPHGQPAQVERLTGMMRALGDTAIVAGDFNAAPWSQTLRTLALAGSLEVNSPGPSWFVTELPQSWRPYAGLPIDHVLTKGLASANRPYPTGDAGSDHLPVIFTFGLEEPEPETEDAGDAEPKVVEHKVVFPTSMEL